MVKLTLTRKNVLFVLGCKLCLLLLIAQQNDKRRKNFQVLFLRNELRNELSELPSLTLFGCIIINSEREVSNFVPLSEFELSVRLLYTLIAALI